MDAFQASVSKLNSFSRDRAVQTSAGRLRLGISGSRFKGLGIQKAMDFGESDLSHH